MNPLFMALHCTRENQLVPRRQLGFQGGGQHTVSQPSRPTRPLDYTATWTSSLCSQNVSRARASVESGSSFTLRDSPPPGVVGAVGSTTAGVLAAQPIAASALARMGASRQP